MALNPRKGFLSQGVPVNLRGIGGPGAPHCFELDRRSEVPTGEGSLPITDRYWGLPPHRDDVILRSFGCAMERATLNRKLNLVPPSTDFWRPVDVFSLFQFFVGPRLSIVKFCPLEGEVAFHQLSSLRTRRYMATTTYNFGAVYFPREVAKARLPIGLPAGVRGRKAARLKNTVCYGSALFYNWKPLPTQWAGNGNDWT